MARNNSKIINTMYISEQKYNKTYNKNSVCLNILNNIYVRIYKYEVIR